MHGVVRCKKKKRKWGEGCEFTKVYVNSIGGSAVDEE